MDRIDAVHIADDGLESGLADVRDFPLDSLINSGDTALDKVIERVLLDLDRSMEDYPAFGSNI